MEENTTPEIETVEETVEDQAWTIRIPKNFLKKAAVATGACIATMLFARYAVSNIQDASYEEGYQDGINDAPTLEIEETSTEESPEE